MQRDVVEAARRGDHEAFDALATAAADRLYRVAALIVRDRDWAQDAVQETLLRAWRELPGLRDPDRFSAWLNRILVNACADQARAQHRWKADVRVIPVEPTTPDHQSSLADRDQLERAFRRLSPVQRAAVVLHFHLGLPVTEVAETLGVPLATAKSRLHYGTMVLRAALDADARPATGSGGKTA